MFLLLLGREIKPRFTKILRRCNDTILGFGTPQLKENTREKYEYAGENVYLDKWTSQKGYLRLTKHPPTPLFSFWPCQPYVSSSSWHGFSIFKYSSLAAFTEKGAMLEVCKIPPSDKACWMFFRNKYWIMQS